MFAFKFLQDADRCTRIEIGGGFYYSYRMFDEQVDVVRYIRPYRFFFENRIRLIQKDFELTNIPSHFNVRYVGKGDPAEQVRIGGKFFPRNQWVIVPVDFDSTNQRGQDMFLVLGFEMRFDSGVRESISDCVDGDNILIIRRYGGLGDIIMQTMMFTQLREMFPTSIIDFAIPKLFWPLLKNCEHYIDNVLDSLDVEQQVYRLLAKRTYDFIGNISVTCSQYEVNCMNTKGFIDKERSDIWAESIGLKLNKHKSCIRFTHGEKEKAWNYLNIDHRPIVAFTPFSANLDRSYPYFLQQILVDKLNEEGFRVLSLHHKKLTLKNCENINADIRFLGALISQIDLMISVDTGPLHYAGILGKPIIGLFGVTDSKVRLRYYNAVAMQGKCEKGEFPCWGRKSNQCLSKHTTWERGMHHMKIQRDMASCMFIQPEEIVQKAKEIVYGSSHKAVENVKHSHGRRTELSL